LPRRQSRDALAALAALVTPVADVAAAVLVHPTPTSARTTLIFKKKKKKKKKKQRFLEILIFTFLRFTLLLPSSRFDFVLSLAWACLFVCLFVLGWLHRILLGAERCSGLCEGSVG
jgi:hypothetical protein